MKDSAKRLYVSLGSLIFISAALYVYSSFINPEFAEIQRLRGERQGQMTLLADYQATIEETNRVIARYESVSALQDVFSEAVPQKENIPSFLNQIYGLAVLNNVLVDSVEFQYMPTQSTSATSLVRPFGTIRATVRCASGYDDIKNFTKAIETNVRLMDIYAVNITEGFRDDPILAYTLTVDTYYQME
jgi:Tfp pilus assembly protein PilO